MAIAAPIRWGIVGAGRIAHQFAADFAHVAGEAELVMIGARSPADAAAFASRYSVPNYGDYQRVFQSDGVDIVYIATPHSLHAEHARAAIIAGKSVLCEKPITTTEEELRALANLAGQHGRYLVEGMWTFFLPAVSRALEWVDRGRIGAVTQLRADFGYPISYCAQRREYAVALAGGALLEMGVYPVSLALRLFGSDPLSVTSHARFAQNGVEDDLSMLLDFELGTASLATSFRSKLPNIAYLVGTEGYIAIPDFWRARECSLHILDECVDRFADSRAGNGFEYEIREVSREVRNGLRESARVPLAHSLRVQALMDRIRSGFGGPAR